MLPQNYSIQISVEICSHYVSYFGIIYNFVTGHTQYGLMGINVGAANGRPYTYICAYIVGFRLRVTGNLISATKTVFVSNSLALSLCHIVSFKWRFSVKNNRKGRTVARRHAYRIKACLSHRCFHDYLCAVCAWSFI